MRHLGLLSSNLSRRGFLGVALAAMLHRDGFASDERALVAARRQAAFSAQGQKRHLALHERRRQPSGNL